MPLCAVVSLPLQVHPMPLLAIMSIIQLFTFILIFATPVHHSLPSFPPFFPSLSLKTCCSLWRAWNSPALLLGHASSYPTFLIPVKQGAFPDPSKAELTVLLWACKGKAIWHCSHFIHPKWLFFVFFSRLWAPWGHRPSIAYALLYHKHPQSSLTQS